MPIGKNSLKRVTNNGYSKVTSSAPDMENSEVNLVSEAGRHTEGILAPKTEEGKAAIARAKTKVSSVSSKAKKQDSKSAPAEAAKKPSRAQKAKETVKTMASEKKKSESKATSAPKKKKAEAAVKENPATSAADSTVSTSREGEGYVNLGGNMPYYLL